jgi:hypothetical protein
LPPWFSSASQAGVGPERDIDGLVLNPTDRFYTAEKKIMARKVELEAADDETLAGSIQPR